MEFLGGAEISERDAFESKIDNGKHNHRNLSNSLVHTCALLIRPYFAQGKFSCLYPVEQSVRTLIADKNLHRYYPIYACKNDCPQNDILLPLENLLKKSGVVVRNEDRQAIIGVVKFKKCTDNEWRDHYKHLTVPDHNTRLVVHHSLYLPEPIPLRLGRGKVQGRWITLPLCVQEKLRVALENLHS